ncbi:GNAT family N-acetyltransferase [Candidatus Poribacteria bacterium]|nr:GNAT family N-acetyltransferase [Candidatus Poribacteria bacterium]
MSALYNKIHVMSSIAISKAKDLSDVDIVKHIADEHRAELGFHARQAYVDSLDKGELLIAKKEDQVVGFVRYHHRRDNRTTLYEIAIIPDVRSKGIGHQLIKALIADCQRVSSRCLRLSCPVELPANHFYEAVGFIRSTRRSRRGRSRPLYEWELPILPNRKLTFVASLTSVSADLKQLIQLWENEGPDRKPFDKCIITPLFIGRRSFDYVRYMHENWGIEVVFDSGGFFVQQGKISYDELFSRLLNFYLKHKWAQTYVLPDFVPTSRQTSEEVEERVHVTAAESVRFLKRLPTDLQSKALGVLQGHTPEHLKYCFDVYMNSGLKNIGFGSFDTTGVNAEINLLTTQTESRLVFVKDLMLRDFLDRKIVSPPNLHLFGVSSPNIINQFKGYLATSFDSSGWQRTAGFGNVYLPFIGRRNVSHKSTALTINKGMSAKEFYAECERTGHSCPFCMDFPRLQENRLVRMWHNAIVFCDMMEEIN